ncbi:tRNA (N(6)-L-threonylcarbamoyladenosine(37)-C(2))-methylthiotransferase MtaB [Nisaea acidiphila]|uniref:tRNA (N(6)-L-threonylcarbamoyladenosine(37)-C(2))-methylthiotransferase n=1 Tax=Nisaea acidiphila TaxID=1862145 RepID=A0A9J7ALI6_9PROT|nr:tRNA (N(6)-L-threonylcarbamoyladenosine(37)-C(2))-methylthiotransferase MtaB [Nisaea acidiphila]UUX48022.1 tRNA (N(6)-L-threonylcarbamoyladenosine(37)-C(2))-methylthiotransferase MtaB [Nisaea acidiphila]
MNETDDNTDGRTTGRPVETFGCRLNAYESEVIRDHLARAGREDVVVINTCAVTREAERQARQAIRKARRANPAAEIVVTGCAAQIDPAAYAAMEEVDRVVGNEEKLKAETWNAPGEARILVNDIMSVKETASHLVAGLEGRARAFVQVQQGCDHRCTFCIIPFGRGNSRSVPMGEIVRQIRELVANGYREIVLTGVDITSYGADLPGKPELGQMVRRLLALVPELPRLRLSSIDAVEIDDDLLQLVRNEPRLMPHLHVSLQAGDDMILKRMKRRHNRSDIITFCREMRAARPDIAFGADIIAGFPTESEEMFANSLALVEECGLSYLHVFPYSARPGTPAAKMPQVPGPLRKERAAMLRAAGERSLARFLDGLSGSLQSVLVEKPDLGRAENFAPVRLEGGVPGEIVPVRITGSDGTHLIGQIERKSAA